MNYLNMVRRYLNSDDFNGLWAWLESQSALPGPRANLQLLYAFCDVCSSVSNERLTDVLVEWLETPIIDAPVNSAAEFPVACAAGGVAGLVSAGSSPQGVHAQVLTEAAHSERWRTREAVVIGLQRRGHSAPVSVLDLLRVWSSTADPFLERAAIATLADPQLLKFPGSLKLAYQVTEISLDRLQSLPVALRKTEGNRVLEKALSHAISVFVAADPEPGFERLERWLAQADRETRKIINTSLGKTRLTNTFPTEVSRMRGILFESDDWER